MRPEVNQLFDLSGKVALIIGGAVNLGRDMAQVLSAAGCAVAISSRERARAQQAARMLEEMGDVAALPLQLDQTQPRQIIEAVEAVMDWKGQIDILVNNAGNGPTSGLGLFERTADDVQQMISTNLIGTLNCCREVARIMVERKSGKIINIASVAGLIGRDRRMYERNKMAGVPVDYSAAKAGLIGMTRDLAAYLAPHDVYVNAISPGGFQREAMPEGFVRDYSDRVPLGRMGRDGIDLKGAALFLASPASDYITGQNLVVDGGFSIWQ